MRKTRWSRLAQHLLTRRKYLALSLIGAAAMPLAACGTVHDSSAHYTSANTTSDRPCTTIAGWAAPEHGARLKVGTERLTKDAPRIVNGVHPAMEDSTVFAYPSKALNISTPGIYTFNFGPLSSAFKWGTATKAAAFSFPSDFKADISAAAVRAKVVTMDGKRYFRVALKITAPPQDPGGLAACRGLVGWIY